MACNSGRDKGLYGGNANDVIYGIIAILHRRNEIQIYLFIFFVCLLLASLLPGFYAIN